MKLKNDFLATKRFFQIVAIDGFCETKVFISSYISLTKIITKHRFKRERVRIGDDSSIFLCCE